MEIVIAGCGKVGYTLAQQLSAEGHSVTVIDQSYARVSALTDNVDVIGVVGNCVSHKTLTQAGVPEADLLIAVTGNDEKNLLCCSIGKKTGHVRTIARVRDPLYNSEMAFLRRTFELSDIINPELEAAQEISRIFQFPAAIGVDTFAKGGVDLLTFQVSAKSILNGLYLKDFRRQTHSHILVCMVSRDGEVTIPDGSFCLQAGDLVSIVADRSSAAAFFEKIGVVRSRIRNVMIVGGGKISYYLIKDLIASNISTTIIENNPARCDELTELFPEATVILGDATDQNLLLEEGLSSTDGFASLTGIDEENILLSLYANRISSDTAKTVTKIGRLSFQSLIDNLDIGSVIYPQDLVASHIIRFVRSLDLSMRRKSGSASSFETLYKLAGGKAEALEFRITEKSPVAGISLSHMKIRPNVMIGCIYRHGTIITPSGSDHLEEGDSVIVVTTGVRILDIADILVA